MELNHHNNVGNNKEKQITQTEILIIGAGASGIGAALSLQNNNIDYIVLEARSRVGGRVLTLPLQNGNAQEKEKENENILVDVGASWIHSYGPNNILFPIVETYKIKESVLDETTRGRIFLDAESGSEFDQQTLRTSSIYSEDFFEEAQEKAKKQENDMSIFEASSEYFTEIRGKMTEKEKRCTEVLINMTEHYEASTTKELSSKNYDFRTDSGSDFLPEGGYGNLLKSITVKNNLKVLFNKEVTSINYEKELIEVMCTDGSIYKSKKIICSLPLGVLKMGKVKFFPQIPENYQKSINALGFGLMNKIIVSFEEKFWGNPAWMSIASEERGKFSQIFNISQKGENILCCFVTDDFAKKIENDSDEQILENFVEFMSKLYPREKIKIKNYIITRWSKEPYSLGSYSSFHSGSSPEDCYLLRKPIENKLFFVGEHCYAEHLGTAHGAFTTGKWAADEIISLLKKQQNK